LPRNELDTREDGTEVPLADLGHACCAGKCRLFRTDVYALGVKAIHLQQPDEVAAPTAKVDDWPGRGRCQQGTDVTPVSESSCFVSAAASVLCGVRLVETAPQVGQANRSHS
jgi:hypothetical protein